MKFVWDIIWKTLSRFVTFVGAIWVIIDIAANFTPEIEEIQKNGCLIMGGAVCITAAIMMKYMKDYFWHKIKIPNTDARICVKIGDITKGKKGSRVIGINNKLETSAAAIAKNSIHEKVIKKHGEAIIQEKFDEAKQKLEKVSGRQEYAFGDAFSCEVQDKHYIFLVMSEMNNPTHPTVGNEQLLGAINRFFHNQKNIHIDQDILCFPVIGTGAGGNSMSQKEVICEIARQFVLFKKSGRDETSRIRDLNIVVWWKNLHSIDWHDMVKEVDAIVAACGDCNTVSAP